MHTSLWRQCACQMRTERKIVTVGWCCDCDGCVEGAGTLENVVVRCRGLALRADAAREETEESLGIMEGRLDRAEHNIKLLQHTVHQHDERIAGFMYSPARSSVAVRACTLPTIVYCCCIPGLRVACEVGVVT